MDDDDARTVGGGQEGRHPHLDEGDIEADPLVTVRRWYEEALATAMVEPGAMTLATVDAQGRPSARAVLLKGIDQRGLRFFTNHNSAKARDLAANPACAVTLVWPPLGRQIRVTGRAERVPRKESAAYFATRPRGSRLGAWASPQSDVIAGRHVLDRRLAELEATYAGTDAIPLPPFWGGYVVVPDTIELWQARPDRLHDRLRCSRPHPGDLWRLERLAP